MLQPMLFAAPDGPWIPIRDADPSASEIFSRHYSRYRYADGRKPAKFIGPGEYMLLMTQNADAIFAWRKFISADGQAGINCAIFRNEGNPDFTASPLIVEADRLAWMRWPGERHYTYVNPRKIKPSRTPGRCFIRAGYRLCGVTKTRKLLIFEKLPEGLLAEAVVA
jgi:hypothetical protein